ncbi:unnamed protein product [Taenia asiatica]|uniref:Bromo domain-containing protein n=1 Tax=Taenia asiatica TaxID=60517 RepID=A0A0R3W9V2_TAEAS|nr:unnamed protein product [Taenia asiatica]
MAAVIGRLAAAGAKTGGKFATKAVTKKGGKGLAKGIGKVGKKKGLKKLVGGKSGKLKKLVEGQLKGAIMSGIDGGCDDEGPGPGAMQSKKPIKIKSPDRRQKSPKKKSGKSPSSSKSKKGSKMKNYAKSKLHLSSLGRHGTGDEDDDDSECGGGTGNSDGERPKSRGKSKRKGKSGTTNSRSKKKTGDDKKDKKHKKHYSSEDESEVTKNKGDKERKNKKHKEKKRRQKSGDNFTDSDSESVRKSEKRNGKKSSKKHAKHSLDESFSDTSDSDIRNKNKRHHKKGKTARRVDSEDDSDASDTECENVAKKEKKGDNKKKEKHNKPDDDDDTADEAKERSRRKWKHKKDKKSGRSDSEVTSSRDERRRSPRNRRSPTHFHPSDTSSDEEVCVSLRDVRFRKINRIDGDERGVDESDCCSQYTSPPTHMSMHELCQVIKEVSNGSGRVNVKRLTKSLAKRACLSPGPSPSTGIEAKRRERMDGRRNAAGDVRQNHTNSNEDRKPKRDKHLRAIQNVFGGRKRQKANKSATPLVNTEENPTPRIEPPVQTPPNSVPAYEDLIDRDFNMMLFKVAKELIMDEYQKKKNCEPEDNDEWLRAFEMVIKFDNAKDIRAAQLKHEEMKLESKYLKKGQVKHFKRSGLGGGDGGGGGRDGDEAYRGEVTMSDGGEGGAEGECRRRSKLDHLYDLIYALRGAPRKGGWKKNQLALPSNVDQSAATQLVPVYLPWELPQTDPYSAYYTDSYGYENQGYYQQC